MEKNLKPNVKRARTCVYNCNVKKKYIKNQKKI